MNLLFRIDEQTSLPACQPPTTPTDLNSLDLSSKRLERHLQQLASRALEMGDTRPLVNNIITNLGRSGIKNSFGGLLIDW